MQVPIVSLGTCTSFAPSQGLTAELGPPREPGTATVPPRDPHLMYKAQERMVLAFCLMMFQLLIVEMEIHANF